MSQLIDIKRKPITLTLGGEEHNIMFSLEAFSELEERYGSIDVAMEELNKGRIKDVKFFLWASMMHEANCPDEKELAKLVDIRDLKGIIAIVMSALKVDAPAASSDQNPKM